VATIQGSPYYLFNREQLLVALAQHAAHLDPHARTRFATEVQEFLDGDAALANGLRIVPKPREVGITTRSSGATEQSDNSSKEQSP
jgi:hypothetical protein